MLRNEKGSSASSLANHATTSAKRRCPCRVLAPAVLLKIKSPSSSTASIKFISGGSALCFATWQTIPGTRSGLAMLVDRSDVALSRRPLLSTLPRSRAATGSAA